MNLDWLSPAALAVVLALFAILFLLRKRGFDFTLSILAALVAGVAVGILFSGHTDWVTPVGKIYVTTLSAIVAPLIIVSLLSSITSLGSTAQLKGIGLRSVLWLMVSTFFAILLSLGLGLIFGVGKNANLVIEGVDAGVFQGRVTPFSEVLIGFFPRNVVSDIAEEKIIPIILFVVLIAVSYVLVANKEQEKVAIFKRFVEAIREIIFKAVEFVIELTPYAVLALVATSTGRGMANKEIVWSLLTLLLVSLLACAIDIWAIGGVLIKVFTGLSLSRFFRKIVPAQVVAFSTQSSAGTLPVTTKVLTERLGVSQEVSAFTASLGTTIGMPGCAGIWPVLTVLYGVHGLGIHYGLLDYGLLILVSLFVSLGTAGVPGTATIVSASVLTALGLPLEILVLIIPIASIADTGRTAANVTGAIVAATIVGRQENELDENIFYGKSALEKQEEKNDETYKEF
jgi:Na+/H+-dicarboxylate symporter